MNYVYLAVAIVAEVVGTSALKESNGFTNVLPSTIVIIGYGVSFYCLSVVLKTIPVGIAYAIWSGVGIVLISLIGAVIFHQKLDTAAITGMLFILAGVVIIYGFSDSVN